jgi:16S rRNA (cytosine967-C5)-methyltransferase
MTPGGRIQALIDILEIILTSPTIPADSIVGYYLKHRSYIGAKDRRFLQDHCFELLRYGTAFPGEPLSARLWVLAYFRWVQNTDDATLRHWFDGGLYHPVPISKSERSKIERCQPTPDPKARIPVWMQEQMKESSGDRPDFFSALFQPACVDVRVNTLKTSVDEAYALLERSGLAPQRMTYSPVGIRCHKRIPHGYMGMKSGHIECQDEGAQIVALLVDPSEKDQILDGCGGAGGKALALAALMNNHGQIILCDPQEFRLLRAKERLRRAGVGNTQVVSMDAVPSTQQFDRVLLDVPCSGSGTWRRKPDLLLRTSEMSLNALIQTQRMILDQGSKKVRPGGLLVYSTCSLFNSENVSNIKWFLEQNPSFQPVTRETCERLFPSHSLAASLYGLSLNPLDHGTDGFFVAILKNLSEN